MGRMEVVAFLSQKGGSGKTTLAVHTAVAAQESGERVAVVDTDIQKSATTWKQARADDTPTLVTVAASELCGVIKAARHDAMTLCIIDTAPHAVPDAARVTAIADLVVIPCRPSAFDLAAVGAAVEIVRAASAKAVLVLSACPFRAPEISRDVFTKYGPPARAVLEALLQKYQDQGVIDLGDPRILQIPPLDTMGTPLQLMKQFGTRSDYMFAVHELQSALYQMEA